MHSKDKLIHGFGINDSDYVTEVKKKTGKISVLQWACPFYVRWKSMLFRCYSASCHKRQPTYIGCTVCEEWLTFSNFKAWMQQQDWQGKHLDKDLIIRGNKVYSPDTCVFVDRLTNNFTTDSAANRGPLMIGVRLFPEKITNRYAACCNNPFTGKVQKVGYFSTEEKAYAAWKKRKHELACQLADMQTDERVAAALRIRYL